MRWRRWIIFGMVLLGLTSVSPVMAHANLLRSSPAANAVLPEPPQEIRLWFTEPLEAEFSRFTLRDIEGNLLDTPTSHRDSSDPYQLFMPSVDLADGLYTVVWRVVSSADGHQTQGSFSFTIGAPIAGYVPPATTSESLPVESASIRWFNLFSMALSVGSIGFVVLVWQPAFQNPEVERRLWQLVTVGWLLLGVASTLMLLQQVSISVGVSLTEAANHPALDSLVTNSRFGELWSARMALWVCLGMVILYQNLRLAWLALLIGLGILLTHSLFSHASAAQDSFIGVMNDWLHLIAATFWLGGLIQFIFVIPAFWKETKTLSKLTAYFSNFARVTVGTLAITGLYSAWLQVGTWQAFRTTDYGHALMVKLILMLPLLGIAAVNLLVTQRRLQAEQIIWGKRLLTFVGVEVALLIAIFVAVGLMTAIAPAKTQLEKQHLSPQIPPSPDPIIEEKRADGLTVRLAVSPGWVGENAFTITLSDRSGDLINDASLIRLRFQKQAENLGESELRTEHRGNGVYEVVGVNLSLAGQWRIRTTIQRPNQYDVVVDFNPTVDFPPQVPTTPIQNNVEPASANRLLVLIGTGVLALGVGGGFWLAGQPTKRHRFQTAALIGIGLIFLLTAVMPIESSNQAPENNADRPVKITFARDRQLPYLITQKGQLLRPTANGDWHSMELEASVNDVYVDFDGNLWAATNQGLFQYQQAGQWQKINEIAASRLVDTHGYLFILGENRLLRGVEHWRDLEPPLRDQPARELVMLSDHSHVLQNGSALYRTSDLGLGWEAIEVPAPASVDQIWVDSNGQLWASTTTGILMWNYLEWRIALPLPDGKLPEEILSFKGRQYALIAGQLFRQNQTTWQAVKISAVSLAVQKWEVLWVLDQNSTLWSSTDGTTWTQIPLVVNGSSLK